MKILLVGAFGKMGKMVTKICREKHISVIKLDKKTKQFNELSSYQIKSIDVVLDFASPDVLSQELEFCKLNNKPLVICSTGHNYKQNKQIKMASKFVKIFKTSNTCVGIYLLQKILKDNYKIIGKFDCVIQEVHHKNKKDNPSGTAKTFAKVLKENNIKYDVVGFRAGDVVGNHSISLFGENEQITISHIATSRKLFAKGAIDICNFLKQQKQIQLYSMEDLIK